MDSIRKFPDGTRRPEYNTWIHMKKRCYSVNNVNYKWYGGKGITVCERWLESFEVFLADLGPRPSGTHSLDRIDRLGNYEPRNCRWATEEEQAQNRSPKYNVSGESTARRDPQVLGEMSLP